MNYKSNKYFNEYDLLKLNSNGYDKEFSPFDYYSKFIYGNANGHYCICTNQELVTHDEYCELCNGKIIINTE